jgi:hypothetical protein
MNKVEWSAEISVGVEPCTSIIMQRNVLCYLDRAKFCENTAPRRVPAGLDLPSPDRESKLIIAPKCLISRRMTTEVRAGACNSRADWANRPSQVDAEPPKVKRLSSTLQ